MQKPAMQQVASSSISQLGYDDVLHLVWVAFHNGTTYIYHEVPKHEYENLLQSSSIGTYFNRFYKNTYDYERVE